jgi:hypothetical protein
VVGLLLIGSALAAAVLLALAAPGGARDPRLGLRVDGLDGGGTPACCGPASTRLSLTAMVVQGSISLSAGLSSSLALLLPR